MGSGGGEGRAAGPEGPFSFAPFSLLTVPVPLQTSKESWREGLCHLDTMRPSSRDRLEAGEEPEPQFEWLLPRGCQQSISTSKRPTQEGVGATPHLGGTTHAICGPGRDQNVQGTVALSAEPGLSPLLAVGSLGLEPALGVPLLAACYSACTERCAFIFISSNCFPILMGS